MHARASKYIPNFRQNETKGNTKYFTTRTHHLHDYSFRPRRRIRKVLPQHGRTVQHTVEEGTRFGVPSRDGCEELRDGFPERLRESARPEAERAPSENALLETPQALVELAQNLSRFVGGEMLCGWKE